MLRGPNPRIEKAREDLREHRGEGALERADAAVATIYDWLLREGHGHIRISAKDGCLADHLKTETIVPTQEGDNRRNLN
jgi:hypothetical protein